jgi:hypothetical protein
MVRRAWTAPSSQDSGSNRSGYAHALANPVAPRPGRTLLPSPIAQAVSFATRSTCFAIWAGSTVGSYGFDVAKLASLSSLELSRSVVESVLSRTGRHLLGRSRSDLSREEAESILESTLASVHRTVSRALFWTTAGFELTGSTISTVSDVSQLLLSSLDQFFGSTDSSRAIASIITLIRREFQNPATGAEGERVSVTDLIVGLSALALLQHHCRKSIDREDQRLGYEEIVWDVVVLNDGERVDVHADMQLNRAATEGDVHTPAPLDPSIIRSIEEHNALDGSDDEDPPELRLKEQIMRSVPPDTTVSISTSTVTAKTITVDVTGPDRPILSPPPGVQVVEERAITTPAHSSLSSGQSTSPPRNSYRVVYRVDRNTQRHAELHRHDDGEPPISHTSGEDEVVQVSPTTNNNISGPLLLSAPTTQETSPDTVPPSLDSLDPILKGQTINYNLSQRPTKEYRKPHDLEGEPPDETQALNTANQKRPRLPLNPLKQGVTASTERRGPNAQSKLSAKMLKQDSTATKPRQESSAEKKAGLKQAFKFGSGHSLSSLWNRDSAMLGQPTTNSPKLPNPSTSIAHNARAPSITHGRKGPLNSSPRVKETRALVETESTPTLHRTPSYSSYISVHERCRDSIVSTTDRFSIHSTDDHCPPTSVVIPSDAGNRGDSGTMTHGLSNRDTELLLPWTSYTRRPETPSLYSIASNDSQTSLVLSSYYQRSAYADSSALLNLRRTGMVESTFPRFHILRNITRYVRFSTASYGSNFMKYLGITKETPLLKSQDNTHRDIRSFIRHTQSTEENILLASFVDPQGGSDSTGSTNTGVPLVHYISLDHESKAVVLACRGTLGFEDVLADLTCDYDDLSWRGRSYKVHKGIHASARRILYGKDGRVLQILKVALEEFQDYGLVLCGHSLGGGVTALLGVMLSEPTVSATGFVTSSNPHSQLLTAGEKAGDAHVCLPPGRPIHVYAYGPPGTMSSSLRKATRGLVTTVVQGNDLVPYLSLGVLHDLRAVALAFKADSGTAKAEIRQRIWERFQTGLSDKWYNFGTNFVRPRDSEWAMSLLKSLRSTMVYEKLLPPGEVFVIESTRVLRRDAFVTRDENHLGRPARRAVLKYVKDVEARFGEARFGTSMLMDHSPASYEDALNTLRMGVSGPEYGY